MKMYNTMTRVDGQRETTDLSRSKSITFGNKSPWETSFVESEDIEYYVT